MAIFKHYRASEERIHGLLKRLSVGKLLDRILEALATRLHRWQDRVSRPTRNVWLLALMFGIFLYGLHALYPLIQYLWNR